MEWDVSLYHQQLWVLGPPLSNSCLSTTVSFLVG